MPQPEINSEFDLLASIASYVRKDFDEQEQIWEGSPFEWIKSLPAARRGKLGKHLVSAWCAAKGLSIDVSKDSEADLLINGHRVEIKFSTLWKVGTYRFQQIRDQNYEYATCLGISPFQAHCWVISKELLRQHVIGHMPQHTGSKGTETFWIIVDPENIPAWLEKCGGTLDEAFVVLNNLSKR